MEKIVIVIVGFWAVFKIYHKAKRLLALYDPSGVIVKILNDKDCNVNIINSIKTLAKKNKAIAIVTYADINNKHCIVDWSYENGSIITYHFVKVNKYWKPKYEN